MSNVWIRSSEQASRRRRISLLKRQESCLIGIGIGRGLVLRLASEDSISTSQIICFLFLVQGIFSQCNIIVSPGERPAGKGQHIAQDSCTGHQYGNLINALAYKCQLGDGPLVICTSVELEVAHTLAVGGLQHPPCSSSSFSCFGDLRDS